MGRGRAPCCDKSKVKKGPWSPGEDFKLISFIQKHGHDNWRSLPKQAGLLRCGKSCRLRWINYLRPDVKRGNFTQEEEETVIKLHNAMGNKWSKIASHLPGRTDNEIKNVWNTHLKKRVLIDGNNVNCNQTENNKESLTSYSASPSPSSSSCISYGGLNSDQKGAGGDQEGQESNVDKNQDPFTIMAFGESKLIDEPKQQASISPSHSNAANIENCSKVEGKKSSFNDCNRTADLEIQNTMIEESNYQDVAADGIIEIPLESDADFWNMLDGFDPTESNESQPQEFEVSQSSNLGENHLEEFEYKKWFRYLENELGLVGGNDGDRPQKGTEQHQQLVRKTSDNEMILRAEFDPALAYFSMWPPSPQNFGI